MKRLLATLLLGASIMANAATTAESPALTVFDPWIRLAPPTAEVLAGYGELRNGADRDLVIQSLASPEFEKVELHEMSMAGGIMKMRRADPYTIKAKDTLKLAPGGWHLMLIGPKQKMPVGAEATVIFHTNAGDVSVRLRVYPPKQ